jgi:hypothetical protein
MSRKARKHWKETIVNATKLLLLKSAEGLIWLLEKRDEYRVAAGKDPFLPH